MKNKHVNGLKNYCQLNQFSSCQRILLTEMSCYVNSIWLMAILWYMICNMKVICIYILYVVWFSRHCGLGLMFWPRPHRKFLASASHFLASLTSLTKIDLRRRQSTSATTSNHSI